VSYWPAVLPDELNRPRLGVGPLGGDRRLPAGRAQREGVPVLLDARIGPVGPRVAGGAVGRAGALPLRAPRLLPPLEVLEEGLQMLKKAAHHLLALLHARPPHGLADKRVSVQVVGGAGHLEGKGPEGLLHATRHRAGREEGLRVPLREAVVVLPVEVVVRLHKPGPHRPRSAALGLNRFGMLDLFLAGRNHGGT